MSGAFYNVYTLQRSEKDDFRTFSIPEISGKRSVAHRAHPADVIVLAPVPIDTLLNRRPLAPGDLLKTFSLGTRS